MAGVGGARLDLGTGNAPISPLADKPGCQEVVVEAQVEFQGLSFVMEFIEGEKLAPGGRRPSVKCSVGEIVGQEQSTLVNLDGMNDVTAGVGWSRLWEEKGLGLAVGFITFPLAALDAELPRQPSRVRYPSSSWIW